MSAMVRQLKSADTLGNPVKVYALAKAAIENVKLSDSMANVQFLQGMAGAVKDIDLNRVNFVQFPTTRHPYQAGRLTTDTASAALLIDIVKSGKPFKVTGTGVSVVEGENGKGGTKTTEPGTGTETPGEKTTKPVKTTKLPSNITGQPASDETCSAGRTIL